MAGAAAVGSLCDCGVRLGRCRRRERPGGPTLKIGVPIALTGPIAEQAQEMVHGYQFYLNQHGNKLGGVPAKIYVEDTQADPAMVIAKTRKLLRAIASISSAGAHWRWSRSRSFR